MLKVYGDESHSKHERAFGIACLVGTDSQWIALCDKWLKRTDGIIFHAADCEAGYGDYKDIQVEIRHRLHRDLTRLLAESQVIGLGTAMDLERCKKVFPNMMPEQNLYSCFIKVVAGIAEEAYKFIPREALGFTFDQHKATEHNKRELYSQMVSLDDWGERAPLDKALRFSSREEVGIQAADLFVRELVKRLDSYLHSDRSVPRIQWETLHATGRFGGSFLMHSYFESLKAKLADLEAKTGITRKKYAEWIHSNGLVENHSNRIRFYAIANNSIANDSVPKPGGDVQAAE